MYDCCVNNNTTKTALKEIIVLKQKTVLKYSNVESKKWYCVNGLQLCEEEIWQKNLQMKNEWISCEMNLMCCINWIHKHTLLKWPRKISLYSLAFLWRYFLHLCFNLQVWKNIKWTKSGIMNLIFIFEEFIRQLYWRLVFRSWVIEYSSESQQLFDARYGVKKWCHIWHRVVVRFLMPDMTLKIWRPFYL